METASTPPLDPNRRAVLERLRRIEGQVRGLQRMVVEGRDCTEILPQMAAVLAATKRTASLLAYQAMGARLAAAIAEGRDPEAAISDLIDLLVRLP